MKIKIKSIAILLMIAIIGLNSNKSNAQTSIFPFSFFLPAHDEIRSQAGGAYVEELLGGTSTSRAYLHSFGLNN